MTEAPTRPGIDHDICLSPRQRRNATTEAGRSRGPVSGRRVPVPDEPDEGDEAREPHEVPRGGGRLSRGGRSQRCDVHAQRGVPLLIGVDLGFGGGAEGQQFTASAKEPHRSREFREPGF